MHCLPPEMVCESKIVADEQEPGAGGGGPQQQLQQLQKKEPRWPASPAPGPPGAVSIREFQPAQREVVRRIFYEGIMERIPNTAFRGLKDQPWTQLGYGAMADTP